MPRVSDQKSCANPTVSVPMITYNHEKFIAQAIESVLMQETDFPVELIIGKDCSTDGTRLVVKAYAEKYPNVIRALLPERNLGMQRNGVAVLMACRGQYIACLEGDDYWTDPRKLQKQVTLMEQNPQYSMCATACRNVVMQPDGKERETGVYPCGNTKKIYNLEDVLSYYPFRTLTFMLKNGLVKFPDWLQRVKYGDMCTLVLFAEQGPIAYLPELTATYRIHQGGIWSGRSISERCEAMRETLDILNDHFSSRYIKILRCRDFRDTRFHCLEAMAKGGEREARRVYWKSFRRFALYMPVASLEFGLLIYGKMDLSQRFVPGDTPPTLAMLLSRLTMRIAIRTRIRKLLKLHGGQER